MKHLLSAANSFEVYSQKLHANYVCITTTVIIIIIIIIIICKET